MPKFVVLAMLALGSLGVRAVPPSISGAFLMCVPSSYTRFDSPGDVHTGVLSLNLCQAQCASSSKKYAFYNSGGQCFCSNTGPGVPEDVYDASTDSSGTCYGTDYSFSVIEPTFQFLGCHTVPDPDMTYSLKGYKYNPEDCFTYCAGYPYMTINIAASTDQYICKCGQTNPGASSLMCNENDQYYYDPTAPVSTGGLTRRSAWQLASRNANLKSCPTGLDACVIPGSKGAYECIDTSSELDSCGGCLRGNFDSPSNSTVGVECSAIEGVASGAVTCSGGRCQAFACLEGYQLVDGACVAL